MKKKTQRNNKNTTQDNSTHTTKRHKRRLILQKLISIEIQLSKQKKTNKRRHIKTQEYRHVD